MALVDAAGHAAELIIAAAKDPQIPIIWAIDSDSEDNDGIEVVLHVIGEPSP